MMLLFVCFSHVKIVCLFSFLSFFFSLKDFSPMDLINDMCMVARDKCFALILQRFESVQLIFFFFSVATILETFIALVHSECRASQAECLLQRALVFFKKKYQLRGFWQSRPVSHLKKACLHDAMFLDEAV